MYFLDFFDVLYIMKQINLQGVQYKFNVPVPVGGDGKDMYRHKNVNTCTTYMKLHMNVHPYHLLQKKTTLPIQCLHHSQPYILHTIRHIARPPVLTTTITTYTPSLVVVNLLSTILSTQHTSPSSVLTKAALRTLRDSTLFTKTKKPQT